MAVEEKPELPCDDILVTATSRDNALIMAGSNFGAMKLKVIERHASTV